MQIKNSFTEVKLMDFKEIMEIIKTFLNAILSVLEALGIKFNKATGTDA